MNEALGVLDEKGRFTLVNQQYCRLVGYSRSELIGSNYIRLHDPAERAMARRQFALRKQGGQTPFEATYRRKDGSPVRVLISAKPTFDAQGRFRGSFGVILDISQRKRAEEALRRNEALFRRLFEANVIGVIAGQNGVITQANGLFLKMVGYSRRDLKEGKVNWRKMTPRKYKALDRRIVEGVLAVGVVTPHEKEYIRKDGTRVPVQVGGALISAEPFRWVCFVRDLTRRNRDQAALRMARDKLEQRVARRTSELARANEVLRREIFERQRAEESLRDSEEKYRQLFATETDAIVLMDVKTRRYTDVNDSACRLYGYTRPEFLRLHMLDTVADRDASLQSALRVVEKKRLFIPYRMHKKKDGTLFPVEIFAGAFKVGGRPMLCAAVRDISVRVRAEQELRAAHAKLVSAREEDRRRLALELHDSVGQKLIAAKLKLGSAMAVGIPDELGELSRTLKELQGQLSGLSTEVREVSRQLYPQTLEALGLPAALRQLAKDCGCQGPRIEIHCDLPEDRRLGPDVEIALYRIAQEALANAIRHGRARRVTVRLGGHQGQCRLSIIDDGGGFRVDLALRGGLGLDSMRERAESIGAKFELTSRPGRTCIQVSLPTA
jgi:PAS domain S-box-containing protein